ncbi:MAG: hypothetical protein ABI633_09150 [Burkholderiales bacterium]
MMPTCCAVSIAIDEGADTAATNSTRARAAFVIISRPTQPDNATQQLRVSRRDQHHGTQQAQDRIALTLDRRRLLGGRLVSGVATGPDRHAAHDGSSICLNDR